MIQKEIVNIFFYWGQGLAFDIFSLGYSW